MDDLNRPSIGAAKMRLRNAFTQLRPMHVFALEIMRLRHWARGALGTAFPHAHRAFSFIGGK
jgi:hypothetical protein